MNKRISMIRWGISFFIGMVACLLSSCDNGLDIQQAYPFTVETMPVQTKIVKGETAEIRCELKREGRYDGARYTIRYFQPDGKGTLRMDDGTVFLPNDRYSLEREVFRLYYTSASTDQQTIDIYVEDNFGQVVQLTFDYENEEKEEVQEWFTQDTRNTRSATSSTRRAMRCCRSSSICPKMRLSGVRSIPKTASLLSR